MSVESMILSKYFIFCLSLSLLPSIFPASGSFPMSQFFPSSGQSIRTSATDLPMNIQGWFPLGLTGLTGFLPKDSQESSPVPQFKNISSSVLSLLYGPALPSVYDYWKNHSLDYMDLCWQIISPLFNMLFRFVIAFLPRSKHLLISWLQSPSAVILEPPQNKISHSFHCFPIYLPWSEGTGLVAMILAFWMLSFKPTFSLSSFTSIKRLFSSSLLSAMSGVICISDVIDISPSNLDSSLCFIQPGISHDVLCI